MDAAGVAQLHAWRDLNPAARVTLYQDTVDDHQAVGQHYRPSLFNPAVRFANTAEIFSAQRPQRPFLDDAYVEAVQDRRIGDAMTLAKGVIKGTMGGQVFDLFDDPFHVWPTSPKVRSDSLVAMAEEDLDDFTTPNRSDFFDHHGIL